jgi:hypothetical protein
MISNLGRDTSLTHEKGTKNKKIKSHLNLESH